MHTATSLRGAVISQCTIELSWLLLLFLSTPYIRDDMRELWAYAWILCQKKRSLVESAIGTYHWLDIWMRDRIKLLIVKLIVGANVDISASVLCRVTVPGSRED